METSNTKQEDGLSDYGSEFTPDEEEILNGLLKQAPDESDNPITDPDLQLKDDEDDFTPRGARVRTVGSASPISSDPTTERRRVTISVVGDSNNTPNFESAASRTERERSVSIEAPLNPEPEVPDLRSPLERFRTKPKKALSVTDLISPSWCELQYWFVLTKHGKKRRTPAMKQGSIVHKTLEDQVHQTVQMDITTKEDAWGLRFWNVIEGLKTLRDTGMTREFEIWGTIDGLVVNGIIDELSDICPDRGLEATQEEKNTTNALPSDQATFTDFFHGSTLENKSQRLSRNDQAKADAARIYLTDVKTRGSKSLPKGASFRPTLMQMMLYHRLLSDLATNKVNADVIFERYSLHADAQFSDSFIAQIGSLNDTFDSSPLPSQDDPISSNRDPLPSTDYLIPSTQDSITVLLAHNSLRALWTFMISEFQRTMPAGAASLGNVLKAEYRNPSDGEIIGVRTFLYDHKITQEYLDDEMRWWKGERSAQGVCVEEAYKCGSCEFADDCGWRKNKIEEATQKMRRSRSVV